MSARPTLAQKIQQTIRMVLEMVVEMRYLHAIGRIQVALLLRVLRLLVVLWKKV